MRHTRLAIGGAIAGLPIAVALVVCASGSRPATDADQVRAVLHGMNGSYNRSDFAAFAAHVCPDLLHGANYEAGWYHSRQTDGPTQIRINSIDIKGDDAAANVRFEAVNHATTLDIDLFRQGADWKACRYQATRAL